MYEGNSVWGGLMSSGRLLVRTVPEVHEDASGFLMRVASANVLGGPSTILARITGAQSVILEQRQLPGLAEYCRNSVSEILQLSGYERREVDGARLWHVAGEWVTKAAFVDLRGVRVCGLCLAQQVHLDGLWGLSHYVACARHGTSLTGRCPACQRPLRWNRRSPRHCNCGADLALSEIQPAPPASLLLAKLIALRAQQPISFVGGSALLPDRMLERLTTLTLDGLLKTVWFLGQCVGNRESLTSGHGRHQPSPLEVEGMASRAFELLRGWPDSLAQALSELADRASQNGEQRMQWLSPIEYWREDLSCNELSFLRVAYECYLRQLWYRFGGHRPRTSDRQLELNWDS